MATHSSILAWKIPWTEKPEKLPSMGLQNVGHDQATKHTHTNFHADNGFLQGSLPGSFFSRSTYSLPNFSHMEAEGIQRTMFTVGLGDFLSVRQGSLPVLHVQADAMVWHIMCILYMLLFSNTQLFWLSSQISSSSLGTLCSAWPFVTQYIANISDHVSASGG